MKSLLFFIVMLVSCIANAVDTNSKEFKSAVEAYRFWYPTVSMEGMMHGLREAGVKENTHMFTAQADASFLGFTANQDTPYGAAMVDISKGPYVIEIPAGPFMGLIDDHSQRWIHDMGIPGPDSGKGGKYLVIPPGYAGTPPRGYHVKKSATNKIFVVVRIIPVGNDLNGAQARLKDIKIYPLSSAKKIRPLTMVNLTGKKGDMTLLKWEDNIQFWEKLSKVINEEAENKMHQAMYDVLKPHGIEKGKQFKPSDETKAFLEAVAKEGKTQLLSKAFIATERPDRVRWTDRKWEWLILSSDAQWAANPDMDTFARDRYFAQAIVMSPAMLKRDPTAGSLYWGAFRDSSGKALDGGKTYKLTVPLPVPARLFWSVTLYDTDTRSLMANGTSKSSLRSLVELADIKNVKSVDLYFAPKAPMGQENRWVKTTNGKSWFSYFRIYGPEVGAFDNTWRPGDFTEVQANTMASQ